MKTDNAKAEIYEEIYKAIISLKLKPNTRLVETKLSEVFSAKRAVIREVLKELALTGLVVNKQNFGASVASPNVKDAADIMQLRQILEIEMITPALMEISDHQIMELETLYKEEQEAIENNDSPKQIQLSMRFHLKLAEYSQNKYLYETLEKLLGISSLVFSIYGVNNNRSCQCNEHALILEAVKAKNVKQAKELMLHHIHTLKSCLDLNADEDNDVDWHAIFNR